MMTEDKVNPTAMVIIGPGAMGCLLAVNLAEAGHTVTLLDKTVARAEVLAGSGIRVDSGPASRRVSVPVTADPACVRAAAWVLLCVKAGDTTAALDAIVPYLGRDTQVVSFQNGVDRAALLTAHVGARRALCAVTGQGAIWQGPGHITHAGAGLTTVAACDPAAGMWAQRLAVILNGAGLAARTMPACGQMLWDKLILNAGINPVTALSGLTNGALLAHPDLFEQACKASCEARTVACAVGEASGIADVADALRRLCVGTSSNLSSMLQDIRRGRPTEINAINGVVVREGRRHGVPVPVNAALIEAVESVSRCVGHGSGVGARPDAR